MAATTTIDPEVAYQVEGIDPALLEPFPAGQRPVYYDPAAAGMEGPNLRVPGQRRWLAFRRGRIEPASPLEEQVVRRHLGAAADRYQGDALTGADGAPQTVGCACGFAAGNLPAAAAHRRLFPDHEMEF